MRPLLEFFNSLKAQFEDDESAIQVIDREIQRANEWVDENTVDELESNPRQLGEIHAPKQPQGTRSIFDDIDADEEQEE